MKTSSAGPAASPKIPNNLKPANRAIKVASGSSRLDPLATLIALFAGFKLFGILGLAAGPALLVFIQAFITTGALKEIWAYITVQSK